MDLFGLIFVVVVTGFVVNLVVKALRAEDNKGQKANVRVGKKGLSLKTKDQIDLELKEAIRKLLDSTENLDNGIRQIVENEIRETPKRAVKALARKTSKHLEEIYELNKVINELSSDLDNLKSEKSLKVKQLSSKETNI